MYQELLKQYNKDKTYLLGCSFGPDSMALLDMLVKGGFKLVVCHVNYHKRDISDFEQESLKKYCESNSIIFETLNVYPDAVKGNFQKWARDVRYNFFKQIYGKYQASALFIAHQQDDLLETYLMQRKKNSVLLYYGLKYETNIFGMNVLRPLLSLKKQELTDYDTRNDVPFSIDISNLSNNYERNRIRHSKIDYLTDDERQEIISEINKLNESNETNIKNIPEYPYKIDDLLKLNDGTFILSLLKLVDNISINFKPLVRTNILNIKKFIMSSNPTGEYKFNDLIFIKSNGYLRVCNRLEIAPINIKVEKPSSYNSQYLDFDFTKDTKDRNISINDYPLLIKSASKTDKYFINNYECEVRRLYIDWKLPKFYRDYWPVIYNKDGKIIYIPRYSDSYKDTHKTLFKIKLPGL